MYCGALLGIANQRHLWEAIRGPNVHIHRSAIDTVSGTNSTTPSTADVIIRLADGSTLPPTQLLIQATGFKTTVPVIFDPPSLALRLGIASPIPRSDSKFSIDQEKLSLIQHWEPLDAAAATRLRQIFGPNSNPPEHTTAPPAEHEPSTPYRLFRRMVSPELAASGDRSFIALGFLLTATTAAVAEVQALWATAFLTGGLDSSSRSSGNGLAMDELSRGDLDREVSEDVVWGIRTGMGIGVDALHYNDTLLRDLGLSPYRAGGGFLAEMTSVYTPKAYSGIVEEWMAKRAKT
ncbi:hypothetical protein BJY04DRAFT_218920 [Aspergillus karnatakaensis]|uniref:uncharacterized protein n=1 Tax=Aspergillus karnatakaensis TaxID=1810916 RepID=UPI003CCDD8D8